jgi:hypothetical protein
MEVFDFSEPAMVSSLSADHPRRRKREFKTLPTSWQTGLGQGTNFADVVAKAVGGT